ncbi:unnamed protein product, partial [marine sediment metagenome]
YLLVMHSFFSIFPFLTNININYYRCKFQNFNKKNNINSTNYAQ